MTLREARCRFTTLLSQLVTELNARGYEVAFDEVRIISPRPVRVGLERVSAEDALHIRTSFHRKGLAADLLLFKDGVYQSKGTEPVYREIEELWRGYDPLCVCGSDWNDANHVSFGEGKPEGKAW